MEENKPKRDGAHVKSQLHIPVPTEPGGKRLRAGILPLHFTYQTFNDYTECHQPRINQ